MDSTKIFSFLPELCVNCGACGIACPVPDRTVCIGCGSCLAVCPTGARKPSDDFSEFMAAAVPHTSNRTYPATGPIVAIVAPAFEANFPGVHKHVLGWLQSKGVVDAFDVGIGAGAAIDSFLAHIRRKAPKLVISQPCPPVVDYIRTRLPALIPFISTVSSPMLQTMRLIRADFAEYRDARFLVVSPCLAKKREFIAEKFPIFNVTFGSISRHLSVNAIDPTIFREIEFRSVEPKWRKHFTEPGGFARAVESQIPEYKGKTYRTDGAPSIYRYLDSLEELINTGKNPLLVDCLNCSNGCLCGTGTEMFANKAAV